MFSSGLNFLGKRQPGAALLEPWQAISIRSSFRPDSRASNSAGNQRKALGLAFTLGVSLILSLCGPAGAHHAVLRSNLEEMTVAADRVFLGKCIAVQETDRMIAQGMMAVTDY